MILTVTVKMAWFVVQTTARISVMAFIGVQIVVLSPLAAQKRNAIRTTGASDVVKVIIGTVLLRRIQIT